MARVSGCRCLHAQSQPIRQTIRQTPNKPEGQTQMPPLRSTRRLDRVRECIRYMHYRRHTQNYYAFQMVALVYVWRTHARRLQLE
jgi:hypothetical protein